MADNEDATIAQFKRNLDHIRINPVEAGPELTLGDITLTFKKKAPLKALVALVDSPNQILGMTEYIRLTLVKGQEEALETLLEEIDVEGLGEILNVLSEAYTSFPDQS